MLTVALFISNTGFHLRVNPPSRQFGGNHRKPRLRRVPRLETHYSLLDGWPKSNSLVTCVICPWHCSRAISALRQRKLDSDWLDHQHNNGHHYLCLYSFYFYWLTLIVWTSPAPTLLLRRNLIRGNWKYEIRLHAQAVHLIALTFRLHLRYVPRTFLHSDVGIKH